MTDLNKLTEAIIGNRKLMDGLHRIVNNLQENP